MFFNFSQKVNSKEEYKVEIKITTHPEVGTVGLPLEFKIFVRNIGKITLEECTLKVRVHEVKVKGYGNGNHLVFEGRTSCDELTPNEIRGYNNEKNGKSNTLITKTNYLTNTKLKKSQTVFSGLSSLKILPNREKRKLSTLKIS